MAAAGLGGLGVVGAAAVTVGPRLMQHSTPSPVGRAPKPGAPTAASPPRSPLDELWERTSLLDDIETVDLSKLLPSSTEGTIRFPRVPQARGLSQGLDMTVNKILREHSFAGGDPSTLRIDGRLVAAGPHVLACILDVEDSYGSAMHSVYYCVEHDRPFTSPGLISHKAWSAFEEAVRSELHALDASAEALTDLLQEQPRPWGNGPTLLPDAQGDLHVLFPPGHGPEQQKDTGVAVVLKAQTVAPWLSVDGAKVVEAIATPGSFDAGSISIPDQDPHDGDECYHRFEQVADPSAEREADGPGPISQLAPRSGVGVRPSAVTAPDATRLRAIALTFDDGPSAELNETLLDALRSNRAAATLFWIGQSVEAALDRGAATALSGIEIGGHSWDHPDLHTLGDEGLSDQISRTADIIAQASARAPFVFRPPYGARNARVDDAVGSFAQSVELWDLDTLDWKHRDAARVLEAVKSDAHRGATILMHEIHPTSVEAVPLILQWLREQEFTVLTAAELGQNQKFAGKHYRHGLVTAEHQLPAPSDGGGD